MAAWRPQPQSGWCCAKLRVPTASCYLRGVRNEHSTRATRLSLLYFALATAALVWPIYPWLGNRIEPRVLGLPWSLAWVLIVIGCNFAVLLVLFQLRVIDDREIDDDDEKEKQREGARR